jgi:signal transduction histidine kinase
MKSSLRYKFISIVLLASIPFLLYALFHYLNTVNESKKAAIKRNMVKAENVAREIQDFIDTSQSVLYSLAMHPAIINNKSAESDNILSQLLPLYPHHLNIIAADMKGRNFASAVSPEKAHKLDYNDREWFIRGSKGVSSVTDLHKSRLFDQPAFMITMPVFKASGEQSAILGFPVNLHSLQDHIVESENLGFYTTLTVFDNKGMVLICTSDKDSIGTPCKRPAVLRLMSEAKSGSFAGADIQGIGRQYSFSTIESTGWKVLVGIETSQVYAEANRGALRHLIFFILICLASVLTAYWFSRQLGARIEILIDGLNRAAAGDLGVRLQITGRDEVSIAGEAFNRMASGREKAEEEIRAFAATLEKRVAQRTVELSNAKNELEAFSYAVSHDLQAPVRHILSFSQILLEDHEAELTETSRDYLHRIGRSCLQMRELITHLLNLSRLNQHLLDRQPADIGSLSRSVCRDLAEAEPGRGVEVVIGEDLKADADPALLEIALQNLLGNAWKYTRGVEHPRIEVGKTVSRGTDCFFVRDNGSGFDMEYVDRLFVPFQRLHSPVEFEGSGVGLATVMRIVQRHGGSIWAEGSPGNGATFYFTLGN